MQHGVALTLTDIPVAFTIFIKCCTYLENLALEDIKDYKQCILAIILLKWYTV